VASYDEAIPPGAAGHVTATVKTARYRGPLQKGVTVTTSDPTQPQVRLAVKLNVVGSVVILPRASLALPGRNWEYSATAVIRKDPGETGELRLTDLTTSAGWLAATARRVEADEPEENGLPARSAGDYVLEVSVADDAPRTRGMQQVRFKTGLPREPETSVPIVVSLNTAMKITPPVVRLRPRGEGQEAVGRFSVVVRPGLDELEASASPPSFSVTLVPNGPRHYSGKVRWTPTEESAPHQGTIVLRSGKESQRLTVRVSAAAARRAQQPETGAGSP
jgi:hypothetical protein